MGRIHTPYGTGDTVTDDYNDIRPEDSVDARKAKLEMWIAKRIGEKLVQHYNNRQWKVIVDIPGRMLIVACDSISNYKGYHIKMAGRNIHELQELSVKAAGEILERHNLARSKHFNADKFETPERDTQDSIIATDSEAEPI